MAQFVTYLIVCFHQIIVLNAQLNLHNFGILTIFCSVVIILKTFIDSIVQKRKGKI